MKKLQHGNKDSEIITISQCADKLNTSEVTVRRLAKQYGAMLKFGKSTRIDWNTLYSAILQNCKVEK